MIRPWVAVPWCLQTFIWPGTRFVFRFFGHWEFEGLRENVRPLKKPLIFAADHSSETDVFMVPAALPFLSRHMPIFYVSRNERDFYLRTGWKRHIYGGTFFKAWGAYPVFGGYGDYEIALHHHLSIVNAGHNVCIFPQGGRKSEIDPHDAHGGVAYLAYHTGAPVIPMATTGNSFMPAEEFFSFKRHIKTKFGAPMYTNDIFGTEPPKDAEGYKRGARNIMQRVKELAEVQNIDNNG